VDPQAQGEYRAFATTATIPCRDDQAGEGYRIHVTGLPTTSAATRP